MMHGDFLGETLCKDCESYDLKERFCKSRSEQSKPTSHCSLFTKKQELVQMEDFLQRKDLFDCLDNELDKEIVQEEQTRKTVLLVALGGKLVKNASPTSSNLMINDDSGAGKDHTVKGVLKILPKEEVIRRKRISEKVFTYWHNAKIEKDWTWDGKIFYNEDISNSVLNSDVFKVMSSSDGINHSTVICKQKVQEVITVGKPVMIITIANAEPKSELIRRFPIANLDTSEDQTKLILKRKAEFHQNGILPKYDQKITESLRKLERVKVKVPFADKLVNLLSTKHIIIRTHFDRLNDYIKFSTAIHQYQRKKDEEGFLLAEAQDYEIGRIALVKTTSNVFSISLTKNQQSILELLKEMPRSKIDKSDATGQEIEVLCWYSVSDIEPKATFCSDRTLRTELDRLTRDGFLAKDKQSRDNSKKPVMVYRYLDSFKVNIPTWEDIQNLSSVSFVSNKSS